MDDIEQFLSLFEDESDQATMDSQRLYLSSLSKEEFEAFRIRFTFQKKLESNYKEGREAQPKEWSVISKKTSETKVLFFIYNFTRETFSLTSSSWATNEPENFSIAPGDYNAYALPSELLRRISSGKSAFKSSQVSHRFTYSSGDYAFNFSTAAALSRGYEPFAFTVPPKLSRQHSIRSTGQREIVCEYILEQNQSASPYSYAISIKISYPD